ncbi:unnamed protein product [Microthlaspi erraticum]|uniref:RNase H type-1 domain-containing protein n=1 Tax=Microthlaspi erraticum TaxID=1685480 RepID=A0A6D2LBH8_9BRAS|nr:unnamed protein product [Microthlaspi erraticum]
MFLWKALHGALPVGLQLEARGIPIDPSCCRCSEPESVLHLLFHCEFACQVWSLAPFSADFNALTCVNVPDGLITAKSMVTLPPVGLESGLLFSWICWAIWISRNQKIFESQNFTAKETVLKAVQDAREWSAAQELGSTSSLPKPIGRPLTNHLGMDFTTCCSDAAWIADPDSAGFAGIGWIFYSGEEVISSYSASLPVVASALVAEALLIRQALLKALELGFLSLMLKSDSLSLIKAITKKSQILEVHSILEDIDLITSSFNCIQFKFIPRLDNSVADSVAKHALRIFMFSRG